MLGEDSERGVFGWSCEENRNEEAVVEGDDRVLCEVRIRKGVNESEFG